MKILQVGDRPGWAKDRLSKPLAELYPQEVTMSYFNLKPERYLATGYSPLQRNLQYSTELGNQFDVVHFHEYDASKKLATQLRQGIKKVLTVHTERKDEMDLDYSMYDVLIAPTRHNLSALSNKHKNVVLVPYGIDLNKYKYTFQDKQENVGFVGRVMKHKRFDVLLKACMDIGFKLIGCGYVEESDVYYKYTHEADQKGLLNWLHLMPEGNIQEMYNRMFVYVCLSEPEIETGPLPVLEAMACGIPVISTEVGWIKDWGHNYDNYIRIKEDEVNKVGMLIKELWLDVGMQRKLTSNGLRLIQDFSIENYGKKLMEVYKS